MQINFKNDSISGHLIPKLDSAYDLGSSTKKWRDLHLSGSTINLGDLTIQSTGGGISIADSDGNTLLQNIKFITVNGDTDILSYDSNTSTFTFNDSDIARTDENETFHKNVTIAGNLTVGGTTTTVNSTTVTIDDPIFTLGGDGNGTNDDKDRGVEFKWHNGSSAKVGFFGMDDTDNVFRYIPDATNTSEVFSGSVGNAEFASVKASAVTDATIECGTF
jgi:parallel beta-helix repeat protein